MALTTSKFLSAGTRVRISEPMRVPSWSEWDNDGGRISTPVKKRLQQAFFDGDKKIAAEIVFISSTDERDRMRNKGIVKVSLRDPAGCSLVITAPADRIQKA
jgi:hypothetical protein